MLVSIIIPNYNHGNFLQQRIESILNQTKTNFELIILDDNSTDNSIIIINKFKTHPKISHIIINSQNSGSTFKQWEKGIMLAKGQYIWIAESDDWSENTFLESTINKFEKDKDLGLVYSDAGIYTNNHLSNTFSLYKNKLLNTDKWSNDYINDGNIEIQEALCFFCSINNASSVVFKKDIIISANVFDLDFKYFGDWYAYLKIASISKIGYISAKLNNYREHDNNISKNAKTDESYLIEYFEIYNWILKNIKIKDTVKFYSYFLGHINAFKSKTTKIKYKTYKNLFKINFKLAFKLICGKFFEEIKSTKKSILD